MRQVSRKTTKKEEIQCETESGHKVTILFDRQVGQPLGNIEASTSVANDPTQDDQTVNGNAMPGMYNSGNSSITFIRVTRPAVGDPNYSVTGKLNAISVGDIVAEIQAGLEEYANEEE